MFSTRLVAVLAVLATVAAVPATDRPAPQPISTINNEDFASPWLSFPPIFGNLFAPLWKLIPTFSEIGPKIIADDTKFQAIVNVADYAKSELKVKVSNDFIQIQGAHEAKQDSHDVFASQFFHTYSLPANCSAADVTAQLTSDGYLIVTAPLNSAGEKTKEADRDVPIEETGKPYKDETEKQTTAAPVTEDDTKEPTTASDRQEVTEKNNNNVNDEINEINP